MFEEGIWKLYWTFHKQIKLTIMALIVFSNICSFLHLVLNILLSVKLDISLSNVLFFKFSDSIFVVFGISKAKMNMAHFIKKLNFNIKAHPGSHMHEP